jgi:hypothetical protein
MPKRSNEFQQLVYLIQCQLATRTGTTVSESALLRDRVDGTEREADVAVQFAQHGTPIILCFECRDQRRKVDLPQVEQLVTKYRRICDKLVIVSSSGFTKPAAARARCEGVETITFQTAGTVDWGAYIDRYSQLHFATFDLTPKQHRIEYEIPQGSLRLTPDEDVVVIQSNGITELISEFHKNLLHDGRLGRLVMDRWCETPQEKRLLEFEFSFDFAPSRAEPIYVSQGRTSGYRLVKFSGTVGATVAQSPVELAPMLFQDTRIMHGKVVLDYGCLAKKTVRLIVSEAKNGEQQGTIAVQAESGGEFHIHHARMNGEPTGT